MSTVVSVSITVPPKAPSFQSLGSRTWILASFYIAVILAIPFWLKTTTIERLPLPRQSVVQWEASLPCPIRIRQSLTLILPNGVIKSEDEYAVADGVRWGLRAAGDGVVEVRKPRQHYVQNQSKEESADEEPESNEKSRVDASDDTKPFRHAACIDWNIRIGRQGEHKAIPAEPYYEIVFDEAIQSKGQVKSTTSGRYFTLSLPKLLKPGHSYDGLEISSILSSYLARLLQLPYTPLYFPGEASVLTLQDRNMTAEQRDEIFRIIGESEEDRRRIPYTRNLRLIFSLINEDVSALGDGIEKGRRASSGVRGWDAFEVEDVVGKRFDSFLKTLGKTQQIYREMQTIWFAPLQFEPKVLETKTRMSNHSTTDEAKLLSEDVESRASATDNHDSLDIPPVHKIERIHLIDWEDLKIFVNSGEWSLTSGTVSSPLSVSMTEGISDDISTLYEQNERTLHFVLYIPKPSHRPLRIAGDADATTISKAKGWLIPQWGGVSIFNLGYEEYELSKIESSQEGILDNLSAYELDQAFITFQKQFLSLIGVKEINLGNIDKEVALVMQLDALTRQRITSSARESVKTLSSIIRLVDKIENLGVGQVVRNDVAKALRLLESAKSLLETTDFDMTTFLTDKEPLQPLQRLLELTHSSVLYSSKAFFNPNMLGLLYFPDEHKYAVYTPLFGPLAVPLLVAGIRLLKEKRSLGKRKA